MILKSIYLSNIRSYTRQKIDFPSGIVLFSGDIGSGKSTILLAIEFALFGIKRGELSGEALLRHGESNGTVILEMLINNCHIIIERALKRTNKSVVQENGSIVIDGKKLELTPIELKARVLDLLGYPASLVGSGKDLIFRYTVYTPQEQMKRILFEDRAARLDILRKIFNIDKYKVIQENTDILVKSLTEKKANKEGLAYGIDEKRLQLKEKFSHLSDLIYEQEKTNEILAGQTDLLEKTKTTFDKLETLKEELAGKKTNLQLIIMEKQAIEEKLAECMRNIGKLKLEIAETKSPEIRQRPEETIEDMKTQVLKKEVEFEEYKKSHIEVRKKYDSCMMELNNLVERCIDMQKEISPYELDKQRFMMLKEKLSEKENIVIQYNEQKKSIDELQHKIIHLKTLLDRSKEMEETVMSMDSCPTCRQEISIMYKQCIKEAEQEKKIKFNEKIESFENSMAVMKKTMESLELRKEEMISVEQEYNFLKNKLDMFQEKKNHLGIIENNISKLEEKKEKLYLELAGFSLHKEGGLNQKLKEYKEKLQNIILYDADIKEYNLIRQQLEKMKEQLVQEENKKDKFETEKEKNAYEKDKLFDEIRILEEKLREYGEVKKTIQGLIEARDKNKIRKSAMDREIQIISLTIGELDKEINEKQDAKEKLNEIQSFLSWVDMKFIPVVKIIEKQTMLQIYREFNDLFCTWFSMLMDDQSLCVRLDDELAPCVTYQGYDMDVQNLSGGEKTAVALAYRLAINKVITHTMTSINTRHLIILDEPTDGFSNEQLDNLKRVLEQLGIPQILIVSHEEKVESFVDNVIKLKKEKGESFIDTMCIDAN